ncbi:MAG: NAD(P)H-hydrate dehydratase [Burkholderiaceae bacterium]|nr:NAD(P)H-hydrate dehydratase [Burkholderiaceae bacterium]
MTINTEPLVNSPSLWQAHFPWPRASDHKYLRGHVLVLGGAMMTGAARLSALAAGRIGAGLVTIAAPLPVWPIYASALTHVMVQPFISVHDWEGLLSDSRKNVIVVGPGAGVSEDTRQHTLSALKTARTVVIDADALTAFSSDPDTLFSAIQGPCVMTPHEGEFACVFTLPGNRLERAVAAAQLSGAVVILKGYETIIASPDGQAVVNTDAPSELATGGTGDVLTGIVAGLLAQGMDPFWAAVAAVWCHSDAARRFGAGLVADDLPTMLPLVLKHLKS